jgi:hypothetical protein
MRIFLFGPKGKKKISEGIDRVPREGPGHKRVAVGRRRT